MSIYRMVDDMFQHHFHPERIAHDVKGLNWQVGLHDPILVEGSKLLDTSLEQEHKIGSHNTLTEPLFCRLLRELAQLGKKVIQERFALSHGLYIA